MPVNPVRSMLVLMMLLVPALLPAPLARAQDGGRALVGEWTLLWRQSGLDEDMNRFREHVVEDVEFPIRSRTVQRGHDNRLVYFNRYGNVIGELVLAPGEQAMASEDGSVHLLWSPDAGHPNVSNFRFYRTENPEPEWEATAAGEPVVLAPDGSFFVLAAPDPEFDGFDRLITDEGGSVQIVGAQGDVRGELPFHPTYVVLTSDAKRVALLHLEELVVLGSDGRLDWNVPVPVDALIRREGRSQLEAGGGYIVVCGTGERAGTGTFRAERRGTIRAFRDDGTPAWSVDQPDDEPLWFQLSASLSPDGSTLATFHSDSREIVVQAWDMPTGRRLWRRTTPRRTGGRCLSVARRGELVVLTHGDFRTLVVAWDREGTVVWEGVLPFDSRTSRVGDHHLLSSAHWIVRLDPEWPQ
jgi:hypothetical protein